MRRYPFAFPYPFSEDDEVKIRGPEGYTLEVGPYRRQAGLSYANYEVSSTFQDQQLVTKRLLRFNGFSFPQEKYPELQGFFNVVHTGDAGQEVLQAGQTGSTQK